jgi:hypothetical protein
MQRERRSPVEHEFSGYFRQLVPNRPLWRGKNFKMRRKVVHTWQDLWDPSESLQPMLNIIDWRRHKGDKPF